MSGVGLVSGVLGSSVLVVPESGFRCSLKVSCRTKCAGSRATNINGREAVCGLRGSSTCSKAKWDIKGSCSFKDA